jgi:hypothetical protein
VSGQLDYFGQNVELALDLPSHLGPGKLGLTPVVVQDATVQALIRERIAGTRTHHVGAVGKTLTTVVDLPRAAAEAPEAAGPDTLQTRQLR